MVGQLPTSPPTKRCRHTADCLENASGRRLLLSSFCPSLCLKSPLGVFFRLFSVNFFVASRGIRRKFCHRKIISREQVCPAALCLLKNCSKILLYNDIVRFSARERSAEAVVLCPEGCPAQQKECNPPGDVTPRGLLFVFDQVPLFPSESTLFFAANSLRLGACSRDT